MNTLPPYSEEELLGFEKFNDVIIPKDLRLYLLKKSRGICRGKYNSCGENKHGNCCYVVELYDGNPHERTQGRYDFDGLFLAAQKAIDDSSKTFLKLKQKELVLAKHGCGEEDYISLISGQVHNVYINVSTDRWLYGRPVFFNEWLTKGIYGYTNDYKLAYAEYRKNLSC